MKTSITIVLGQKPNIEINIEFDYVIEVSPTGWVSFKNKQTNVAFAVFNNPIGWTIKSN